LYFVHTVTESCRCLCAFFVRLHRRLQWSHDPTNCARDDEVMGFSKWKTHWWRQDPITSPDRRPYVHGTAVMHRINGSPGLLDRIVGMPSLMIKLQKTPHAFRRSLRAVPQGQNPILKTCSTEDFGNCIGSVQRISNQTLKYRRGGNYKEDESHALDCK
jgi:hypothetical protein